jgi:hypothetical protein
VKIAHISILGAMAWVYQLCSVHAGNIMDVDHTFQDQMLALHALRKMSKRCGPDLRSEFDEIYIIKVMKLQDHNAMPRKCLDTPE